MTMTTSPAKLLRAACFFAAVSPLVNAWVPLLGRAQSAGLSPVQSPTQSPAQSPAGSQPGAQPPLRFEVASIRPHGSGGDDPSDRKMLPGGRFIATATPVRTLIRIAFGSDGISGAPGWIDNETFDISATTVNHTEVTTPQQFQQLILSLLEDRFAFKFHREEKEVPVYWLEMDKPGKPGPALRPSAADSQPNMSRNANGSRAVMKVSKMSMADVAAALSRQAGRPVEDHTDLKGDFDFQIEWAPEETPDSTDASLFTVLREQLGLRLRPAKGTAETVVIDQISRPSAN
jgi:uncharacterized protein (TIGR03435 family)